MSVELVFRPKPEDVPEIMRRTMLTLGQPFVELPLRPAEHKVLAVIDGLKVRRADVEMCFNDTMTMNFVYAAAGRKSEDNDPPGSRMALLRTFARELYGAYGMWVEENFGTICLECRLVLPEHTLMCGAGERNRRSRNRLAYKKER